MNANDQASAGLSAAERATLNRVLDVLIPAAEGMPSAGSVDVAERWIDDALRLRPDLRGQLLACMGAVDAGPDVAAALRGFAVADPEAFEAVGTLVVGAYYMDDRARAALGYPGQEDRRLDDDTEEYFEMLERVVERGPLYRPTPS